MSFLFFIWLFIVSLHHYVIDCIVESNVHLRMPGIGQKISNCWICISLMLNVELMRGKVALTLLLVSLVLFTSQCSLIRLSQRCYNNQLRWKGNWVNLPVGTDGVVERRTGLLLTGAYQETISATLFYGSISLCEDSNAPLVSTCSLSPCKRNESHKLTLTLVCLPDHTFAVSCKTWGPVAPFLSTVSALFTPPYVVCTIILMLTCIIWWIWVENSLGVKGWI